MTQNTNTPKEHIAYQLLLLPADKQSFLMDVIEILCESPHNTKVNAHLNENLPPYKFTMPDIVGFKRSDPLNMLQLVEQTTVLKLQDYKLILINISKLNCPNCGDKTCVTMEYQKRNQHTGSVDFEVCLSCYTVYKMTPIYASAEDGV